MAEPVAPIPSWPDDVWNDPSFRCFFSSRYSVNTSAGRAVENFADFTHFPFVHAGLLSTIEQAVTRSHEIIETDYGLMYRYEEKEPELDRTLTGTLDGSAGQPFYWEYHIYLPFTAHYRKITPSTGEVRHLMFVAAPTSPKHTDAYLFIARNHALDEADSSFKEFADYVMSQDIQIIESQRPEEIPLDLREELHLKVPDAASIAYRRALTGIEGVSPFLP